MYREHLHQLHHRMVRQHCACREWWERSPGLHCPLWRKVPQTHSHPAELFTRLLSGRRYTSVKWRITRLRNSFLLKAIRLLNNCLEFITRVQLIVSTSYSCVSLVHHSPTLSTFILFSYSVLEPFLLLFICYLLFMFIVRSCFMTLMRTANNFIVQKQTLFF